MKHRITARFQDTETAKSVCIYLSALYNAQYDITAVRDDSFYSFSAIIPTNIPGANFLSGIFCPVFPENTTVDEIISRKGAITEIRCYEKYSSEVIRYIIKHGGRILQS